MKIVELSNIETDIKEISFDFLDSVENTINEYVEKFDYINIEDNFISIEKITDKPYYNFDNEEDLI